MANELLKEIFNGVFNILRKPVVIGVLLLLIGGIIRYKFPEKRIEIEKLEKNKSIK